MSAAEDVASYLPAMAIATALDSGARRQANGGWKCRCPCHADANPSLSVWDTGDPGRPVGLKCYGGCAWKVVVKELEGRGLWPRWRPPGRVAATYDYRDEEGRLVYQSVRMEPKDFYQRQPVPGGWDYSLRTQDGRQVTRFPYNLQAILADEVSAVFVVEGEKDVERLSSEGFLATCNSEGAGKWRLELGQWLRGRSVILVPDNDQAGERHANDVGRKLEGLAAEVRVLRLPGLPDKGDASDWFAAGGTAAEFERLAAASPLWVASAEPQPSTDDLGANIVEFPSTRRRRRPPPDQGDDGKPTIKVLPGGIHNVVDQSEAALMAAPDAPDVYKFGDILVEVGIANIKTSGNGTDKSLRNHVLGQPRLYELFSRSANYVKWSRTDGAWVPMNPPEKAVEVYLGRPGTWNFPAITGTVTAPTLRRDGTLLTEPGYDAASGLYYDPMGMRVPALLNRPTKRAAERALRMLKQPLRLYRFETEADRTAAVASIMTAVLRRSVPTAPAFAFDGPVAGVGKSMLVDVASVVASGHRAAVTLAKRGTGEEELEKRLSASLLAGDQVISLDNLEVPLGGAFLNQIVTQHAVKIRLFRTLENVTVPMGSCIFATGNNLVVDGDMTRRVLVIRVVSESPEPEKAKFPFDPVELALRARRHLVYAVLTIARAYSIVPWRERDRTTLGSFNDWCRLVREPLIWLGEPDPCEVMSRVKDTDPRRAGLIAVMGEWLRHVGAGVETNVGDIIDRASHREIDDRGEPGQLDRASFYDVLRQVAEGHGRGRDGISSKSLGWFLRRHQGRPIKMGNDTYRFVQVSGRDEGRVAGWKLDRI